MAGDDQKRLMELQMAALKVEHAIDEEGESQLPRIPKNARSANNEKIAKLYDDAAEYEAELKCFEEELEVINENSFSDIAKVMAEKFPQYEGNYEEDLKSLIFDTWKNLVEVEQTHPTEQLSLIQVSSFCDLIDSLNKEFPNYTGDFESEVKDILVKRWEMLIAVKKEHVKEELADMKLRGMKANHIRRVYRNYHGITD